MVMLGNSHKRIYSAIVGIHYLLAGQVYQAPPTGRLQAAQHGVSRGSSDSVPSLLLKASPQMQRKESVLIPVHLSWAAGKALLSLGVLTRLM